MANSNWEHKRRRPFTKTSCEIFLLYSSCFLFLVSIPKTATDFQLVSSFSLSYQAPCSACGFRFYFSVTSTWQPISRKIKRNVRRHTAIILAKLACIFSVFKFTQNLISWIKSWITLTKLFNRLAKFAPWFFRSCNTSDIILPRSVSLIWFSERALCSRGRVPL